MMRGMVRDPLHPSQPGGQELHEFVVYASRQLPTLDNLAEDARGRGHFVYL